MPGSKKARLPHLAPLVTTHGHLRNTETRKNDGVQFGPGKYGTERFTYVRNHGAAILTGDRLENTFLKSLWIWSLKRH